MAINIVMPAQDQLAKNKTRIMVIGVGGGGGNLVDQLSREGVTTAETCAINTDGAALDKVLSMNKIYLNKEDLNGAGGNPEIGKEAMNGNKDELKRLLKGSKLAIIAVCEGGGTGTGAAPVIAKIASEMEILTIAVVTKPFAYEGARMKIAEAGIEELRKYVDTTIVISNQKALSVAEILNGAVGTGFQEINKILTTAVRSISDLMNKPQKINGDFMDLKTVVKNSGLAHISYGQATGTDKFQKAYDAAIANPLLETKLNGAHGLIINVVSDTSLPLGTFHKFGKELNDLIYPGSHFKFCHGVDPNMPADTASVYFFAAGFDDGFNPDLPAQSESQFNNTEENESFASDFFSDPFGESKNTHSPADKLTWDSHSLDNLSSPFDDDDDLIIPPDKKPEETLFTPPPKPTAPPIKPTTTKRAFGSFFGKK